MAELQTKVDPVMEKAWQRAKRLEKMNFWRKSEYQPMNIEPMKFERSRLIKEMTPEERALRKQWVQDQTIRHPKRNVAGLQPLNIFRRIFRMPMNTFETVLGNVTVSFLRK